MSGSFVLTQYQHLTSKNTAVYLAKFHYDDARQQIQSDSKTKDEGTLKQHDTVVIVPAEEDNFHPIATQNLTDSLDTRDVFGQHLAMLVVYQLTRTVNSCTPAPETAFNVHILRS